MTKKTIDELKAEIIRESDAFFEASPIKKVERGGLLGYGVPENMVAEDVLKLTVLMYEFDRKRSLLIGDLYALSNKLPQLDQEDTRHEDFMKDFYMPILHVSFSDLEKQKIVLHIIMKRFLKMEEHISDYKQLCYGWSYDSEGNTWSVDKYGNLDFHEAYKKDVKKKPLDSESSN